MTGVVGNYGRANLATGDAMVGWSQAGFVYSVYGVSDAYADSCSHYANELEGGGRSVKTFLNLASNA